MEKNRSRHNQLCTYVGWFLQAFSQSENVFSAFERFVLRLQFCCCMIVLDLLASLQQFRFFWLHGFVRLVRTSYRLISFVVAGFRVTATISLRFGFVRLVRTSYRLHFGLGVCPRFLSVFFFLFDKDTLLVVSHKAASQQQQQYALISTTALQTARQRQQQQSYRQYSINNSNNKQTNHNNNNTRMDDFGWCTG